MKRRKTRIVKIGRVTVGGNAPISVQSMTKTDTRDAKATVRQIRGLEKAGCEIIRVAVPDREAATCLRKIKSQINIPLIADIHFDYRLALAAIEEGVDGLRLNPGNIRDKRKIKTVVKAAKEGNVPIRIGVNSGSLAPIYQSRVRHYSLARAMVESACDYIKTFEDLDFHDIIISLKSPEVPATIEAYRLMAKQCRYPFHLGMTAAGPPGPGSICSAVSLGILLWEGIGDTVRVSLTGNPKEEVKAGYEILKALGLRRYGLTIISCPTCGRCQIDLVKIVKEVERELSRLTSSTTDRSHLPAVNRQVPPLKVAIMGCVVNGPGEAKQADIGIAGGRGFGVLFRKGKVIGKVKEAQLVKTLIKEVRGKV